MFVKPYTQQQLIIYQIETVQVSIVDKNKQAQSYTLLQIDRSYCDGCWGGKPQGRCYLLLLRAAAPHLAN